MGYFPLRKNMAGLVGAIALLYCLYAADQAGLFANWTWINSFSYTLWKMIGVGFDFGLRSNKQEAVNYAVNTLGITDANFDNVDNDLQTYWTLGLSYKF